MADQSTLREDALQFHVGGRRHGKIEVNATKALTTQRDLALAYSPGVASSRSRSKPIRQPHTTTPRKVTSSR